MKNSIFALSVLLFAACSPSSNKSADSAPSGQTRTSYNLTSVEGFIVKPVQLQENVTASGTVLPAEETMLHPEATGRVIQINLPEGKSVAKGTLLLKIFDEDLKTQLQKLETQLKQAEITEQRLGDLLKVKGVSQQEYDLAALQVQTTKSDLELVKINIAKTEVRAPFDGVIGLRNVSPGAYVTPATELASIRAVNTLKLDFSVPEKYGAMLHPGLQISFKTENSQTPYKAVVMATEQNIDAATRNLLVRAQVEGNKTGLLPGAFAEVSLDLKNKPQALMVPSQTLVPMARDKKVYVSRNGKADFVTVQTGIRQAGMVEVLSGLQAGDTIATTGILFLRPGGAVRFSKVD